MILRRRLLLPTGLHLEVAEAGRASSPALVLLHGITDSWRSFESVLPYLQRRFRVVAPSLRGHGGSDRPERGYSPSAMATDVAQLLDVLRVPEAVVAGHSMGASVALRLAMEAPRRVTGLVLAGGVASWIGNRDLAGLAAEAAALPDPVPREHARAFQESTLARPIPPAFLDMAVGESLRVPARVWREAFAALCEEHATPRLGEIRCPVTLAWGDRDDLTASQQPVLLHRLRGARLVTRPAGGHALHWEEPAWFAGLVSEAAREAAQEAESLLTQAT